MNKPGFFRGAVLAACLALTGAIVYAGLSTVIGSALAIRAVTAALGGAYVLYLLRRSEERSGRIAVFAGWGFVTTGIWMFADSLAMTFITQAILISLVRTLYHHRSSLAALLDLGLSAFALSAAVWASAQSGSFFLTVWCFFLVQALFVGIPSEFTNHGSKSSAVDDQFGRAFRTAETAIHRIATQR